MKYFITLAECRNFTKASKVLYISQSGLSRRIADLEKKLGVQLFERTAHSVTLTSAGEALLDDAIAFVNRADVLLAHAGTVKEGFSGKLTIGYEGWVEKPYFSDCVKNFHSNNPNAQLFIEQSTEIDLLRQLDQGYIDIVVTLASGLENYPNFHFEKLHDTYCYLMASKNRPISKRASTMLDELKHEPMIALNYSSSPYMSTYGGYVMAARGFAANNIRFASTRLAQAHYVNADIGFAITALPYKNIHSKCDIRFVKIENHDEVSYCAITRKDCSNVLAEKFVEEVKQSIASVDVYNFYI